MKNYSLADIREALRYGNENNYILFPEIKIIDNYKKALDNNVTGETIKQAIEIANYYKDKRNEELSFSKFIMFLEDGNRRKYEDLFFENKKALHSLVIAELFLDNGEYIEAISERLWQWCNEYSWELPAHVPLDKENIERLGYDASITVALFSAETGFYFAEILSLIKHKLHPLLAYRIEKEINKRVITSYEENTFYWEDAKMNWSSVCAGSSGAAAIYLISDVNRLAKIISRVISSMSSFLQGFDSEGVITEGLGYWQYGFSFYLCFSELLKDRTCGMIDLMRADELVEKIAKAPLVLQFSKGKFINYSDAPKSTWYGEIGTLSKLADIFDIDGFVYSEKIDVASDDTSKWAYLSRNIFWSINLKQNEAKTMKVSKYYEDCQWAIEIVEDDNHNFIGFSAKGGNNNEPHNHNDLGHFILHANGENVFCDLGAPEYVKDFFNPEKRYSFIHTSSKGHSVPAINGQYQMFGSEVEASLIEYETNKNTKFVLDLTKAYEVNNLSSFVRRFDFHKNKCILSITDSFLFNEGLNTVEEAFVTQGNVKEIKPGLLQVEENGVIFNICYDDDLIYSMENIVYLNHSGITESVNRISIRCNNISKEKTIIINISLQS